MVTSACRLGNGCTEEVTCEGSVRGGCAGKGGDVIIDTVYKQLDTIRECRQFDVAGAQGVKQGCREH